MNVADDRLHSIGYMPALDGLRAVSILLVIVSHFGFGHVVPGGLGVTIFFFISGFIITHILLRESAVTGDISLKAFYVKRFFRLGPALLVYIGLCVAFFAAVGRPLPAVDVAAALLYWANHHHIWHGWSSETTLPPLAILWSLAVEEHFYLAFPLLVLALQHRLDRLLLVLVTICAAILAWRIYLVYGIGLPSVSPAHTEQGTDARIDSIGYGCIVSVLVAIVAARKRPDVSPILRGLGSTPALGAGGMLMLVTLLWRDAAFRESWRYSLQGIALAPLFVHLFVLHRRGALHGALASRSMVFVGKVSYSLYLYHWFALAALLQLLGNAPAVIFAARSLAVPLTVVLALASYHLVETPLRRYGHRLADRMTRTA